MLEIKWGHTFHNNFCQPQILYSSLLKKWECRAIMVPFWIPLLFTIQLYYWIVGQKDWFAMCKILTTDKWKKKTLEFFKSKYICTFCRKIHLSGIMNILNTIIYYLETNRNDFSSILPQVFKCEFLRLRSWFVINCSCTGTTTFFQGFLPKS